MAQKTRAIIRKLALPLEIKFGDDTIISDGFFVLTSKEVRRLNITSIGEDGYVTCEIFPSKKEEVLSLKSFIREDNLIGTEISKTRGSGADFGQYRYYARPDGHLYAVISGKRIRRIQLGKLTDRDSPISIAVRTILRSFNSDEFTKKALASKLPKRLSHGQILKAILDVLTIEGYLQKREIQFRGRLQETFKSTDKLVKVAFTSPEQSYKV